MTLAWAILACATASSAEPQHERAKDAIATQVRIQGYSCTAPQSAKRLPRFSMPGMAAWLLKCENATYRVRLVPDMAARVERIGKRPVTGR